MLEFYLKTEIRWTGVASPDDRGSGRSGNLASGSVAGSRSFFALSKGGFGACATPPPAVWSARGRHGSNLTPAERLNLPAMFTRFSIF